MTISAHEVSAQNLAESKRFGEKFFVKIRWFVVVKMRSNCCWCLPIQTYEGRGVTGDKQRSRHAIIYTGDTVPPLRPEEMTQRNRLPLGDAIRVVPDPHWEKLDPMSRINFDQVYTVQHNVKVRHFGKVHKNSERALVYQFMNACKSDSTAPRRDRPARTSSDYSTNQKSNTKIATDNDVNTRSSIFADHQATESQPSPHQPALNWGSVVGASRGTFGSNISSAPKELNAGSSTERAYQPAEGQLSPYQQPSVLGSTIKPPYALGGSTPASSSAYPSRPVYPQSLASSGAQEQAFQTHQTKRRGSEFEAAMGTSSQSNQQPRPRGNTRPAEQWQLNYPAQSGGSIEPEDTPMDDGNDPEASEASSTLALGNNVKDEQHSGKEPERPHRRQKQDTRVIGGEREHARRNEGGKRRNSEYGSQRWLG
ncbi:hypothetical protein BU16DRAFT_92975 [Lophium mytilinum]|uniref:DUF6590 domain-containing protein n=1 Tax=Lophium mytilinum TaxID=390894 RepID=A0A6A6QLB5_9PEZI|nr:hypothetical protein BU16DRAFT_92975 [Lophium mytilinum]